jgi:hypothetical protein
MSGEAKRPEREVGAIPPDAGQATPAPRNDDPKRRPPASGTGGAGSAEAGRLGRLADRKKE